MDSDLLTPVIYRAYHKGNPTAAQDLSFNRSPKPTGLLIKESGWQIKFFAYRNFCLRIHVLSVAMDTVLIKLNVDSILSHR